MDVDEAKRRARAGSLFLIARRAFAVLITIVSTVTIARLVAPRDYGLANMSLIILSLGAVFRDFGLTNAILRKSVVDQAELSSVFWFNALMTTVLSVLIAASSTRIALFYGEPAVSSIIVVSLVGFFLSGLSLQHRSVLNRALRFGAIAWIESGAQLLGFLAALGLALRWHNVWAIVLGNLVQAIFSALAYIAVARWRPGRPMALRDLGELLRFGANLSIFSLAVFASQNVVSLLIGRFLGAAPLGQYSRAQSLFQLPITNLIQPLTQAMTPLLTRLRNDEAEYRSAYLALLRKMNIIFIPLSVMLVFLGEPLVKVVLGGQWSEAGRAFSALSPAFAGLGLAYAVADLFVTQDRSAELRKLGLYELVLRVGTTCAALPFGIVAAALAYACTNLISAAIRLYVIGQTGPISVSDQVSVLVSALPFGLGAMIGCFTGLLISDFLGSFDSLTLIFIVGVSGGSATIIVGIAVRRSRLALTEVARELGIARLIRRLLTLRGA